MLVNKKRKGSKKAISILLVLIILITTSTVSAATYSASLNGSKNTAKTTQITATSNKTSKVKATNSGNNTSTNGSAKRVVFILPDSTVASTGWLDPRTEKTVNYSQEKDKKILWTNRWTNPKFKRNSIAYN